MLPRDYNFVTAIGGTLSGTDSGASIRPFQYDGNSRGMLVHIVGEDLSADELAGNTSYVRKYYTNAGAVTDGIVWSPAAGTRWYITDIFVGVSADATVTLEDDLAAGDSIIWKHEVAAKSGWDHTFKTPLFSGEDAADLLVTTNTGNIYITITGYEV